MRRGGGGPRQPGGGRQIAGPRDHDRGAPFAARRENRFSRSHRTSQERHKPGSKPRPARKPAEASVSAAAATHPVQATGVQNVTVTADEAGMRVDRFLEARFPGLAFSHIQRVIRKGELRVNGRRVEPKDRLAAGQAVRIPPLKLEAPKPRREEGGEAEKTRA